jgi:hypothetical protein
MAEQHAECLGLSNGWRQRFLAEDEARASLSQRPQHTDVRRLIDCNHYHVGNDAIEGGVQDGEYRNPLSRPGLKPIGIGVNYAAEADLTTLLFQMLDRLDEAAAGVPCSYDQNARR